MELFLQDMKTLAERLAYAMNETGNQNQTDLAKKSAVSQSTISKILRGENKTSKETGKLAKAMGVSADWLISGQGSVWGSSNSKIESVDASKQVALWDVSGDTGSKISWLAELPSHFQAYVMSGNTGISKVPKGAIVIVDPEAKPLTNDLVVAEVSGSLSVFTYYLNGAGESFLSVDDERIPLAKVSNSSIRGPVQQIYIPTLSR